MKRIICTLIILFLSYSSYNQNFISESKQWNVVLFSWGGISTEIFRISEDSIVNTLSYKKIWVSYDSLNSWVFQGLLREDSNMVFYIPPNRTEGKLYDFNLEAGDSSFVKNIFCEDEIPIYVSNVDTVDYFGIQRKRWTLENEIFGKEYWVEGIGSLNGPLYTKYTACIICPEWNLLCYFDSGLLQYSLYGGGDCFTVGINEKTISGRIHIKPNPVRRGDNIEIRLSQKPFLINIFNVSGALVSTFSSNISDPVRIETYNLMPGLYILQCLSYGNKTVIAKFIVM